ncbi:MAG: helix-turn-helix transcriptional regulator [Clostridia bacterium]|nr:helix-turn-helix transcriptional regulator [Clostridia bacterium]
MTTIGENLKQLRRARGITQEELAEMLGVTPQSVSQWECGRTLPDISLLAPLAHTFEVSSDTILGIDVESKQRQIDTLYDEAYSIAASGDHVRAISLANTALKRFPSSYKLMDFYANEIWLYNYLCPEEVREAQQTRALAYLEKILAECTTPDIRNNSLILACLWYAGLGRTEDAERLAGTLNGMHFTYGELMAKITTGRRQYEIIRDEMLGQFTGAVGYLLDALLETKDDSGTPMYTEDEKLALDRMCVEMFALYFPDGDYLFHAQYVAGAYRQMADIYAGRGDRDNAILHARRAAEFSIQFDRVRPDDTHTSPAARGMEAGGIWWHDGHNTAHDWLNALNTRPVYDFMREDAEFKEIVALLAENAK